MSTETDDDVQDQGLGTEADDNADGLKIETVRESITRSLQESRDADGDGGDEPGDGAPPKVDKQDKGGAKARPKKDAKAAGAVDGDAAKGAKGAQNDSAGGADGTPDPATSGPPVAWTKDEKALWNDLPPAIQKAVQRRESDSQRGVEQLKSKYGELDSAVAPHREAIRRFGVSDAQAVAQLFRWHHALGDPNPNTRVEAFKLLAKSFNVDTATLSGPANGSQDASGNELQPHLQPIRQAVDQLTRRFSDYENHQSAAVVTAAKDTVTSWAQDKPHFETVRADMYRLIAAEQVPLLQSGYPDLDQAYEMAVWANASTRPLMLAEEQARQAAANNGLVRRAKSAGASLRPRAPAAPMGAPSGDEPKVGESVRDSIKRALAQARA